jgi:excisionase family DNA binding protein
MEQANGSHAEPSIKLQERAAWSVGEFAALHGLSRATVWRRIRTGEIAVVRSGRRTLITRASVKDWLTRLQSPQAA